jgi:hypothetical protein
MIIGADKIATLGGATGGGGTPPSAPVALAATYITQNSFVTNWYPSAGATGYYLDVATDSGFTNFVSGYNNLNVGIPAYNIGTGTYSYPVSGLVASTNYYFRVRAYNANGTGPSSNTILVTTSAPPPVYYSYTISCSCTRNCVSCGGVGYAVWTASNCSGCNASAGPVGGCAGSGTKRATYTGTTYSSPSGGCWT